jgi:hypothetical protein
MNEPLYLDEIPEFEKIGAVVQLADDDEQWRRQILDEALRTLPYLERYQVTVNLDRADAEAGHGLGTIEVTPQQYPDTMGAKTKSILIPVIIRSRMLQPLDVFLLGDRAFPISEERVDQALFRPESFSVSKRKKEPQGFLSDAFVPQGGWQKWYKGAHILPELVGTILEADKADIKQAVASDEFLSRMVRTSRSFGEKVAGIIHSDTTDVAKTASAILSEMETADVVQFRKEANIGAISVYCGTADPYKFTIKTIPYGDFQKIASEDMVERVDGEGHVTITAEAAKRVDLSGEKLELASDFGEWRVQTTDGRDLLGWVIPNLIDFDMNTHGLCLFTNGSENALQEGIAGSRVGKGANLPQHQPNAKDQGIFYCVRNGSVIATIPVAISGSTDQGYVGEDVHGRPFVARTQKGEFQQGLRGIAMEAEGRYLLPEDFKFMRIGAAGVTLVATPERMNPASEKLAFISPRMEIDYFTGDLWKLAYHNVSDDENVPTDIVPQNLSGVELWGSLIGVPVEDLRKTAALAKANQHERHYVYGDRKLSSEGSPAHLEKVATLLKLAMESRRGLLREAAAIGMGFEKLGQKESAEDSVDAMLSVGLVTPENIDVLREYIPALEDAASKLAAALLSVRVGGINEIPEGALERALMYMEQSISGIRKATQVINY